MHPEASVYTGAFCRSEFQSKDGNVTASPAQRVGKAFTYAKRNTQIDASPPWIDITAIATNLITRDLQQLFPYSRVKLWERAVQLWDTICQRASPHRQSLALSRSRICYTYYSVPCLSTCLDFGLVNGLAGPLLSRDWDSCGLVVFAPKLMPLWMAAPIACCMAVTHAKYVSSLSACNIWLLRTTKTLWDSSPDISIHFSCTALQRARWICIFTYLVGLNTSKQFLLSQSTTGFTVHSRRSSSMIV